MRRPGRLAQRPRLCCGVKRHAPGPTGHHRQGKCCIQPPQIGPRRGPLLRNQRQPRLPVRNPPRPRRHQRRQIAPRPRPWQQRPQPLVQRRVRRILRLGRPRQRRRRGVLVQPAQQMGQRRHIAAGRHLARQIRNGTFRLGLRPRQFPTGDIQRLPHPRLRLDPRAHLGHRRPTGQHRCRIGPGPPQPVQRRLDPQHQHRRLGAPRRQVLDRLVMARPQFPRRPDPPPQRQHHRIGHLRRPLGLQSVQRPRQHPHLARRRSPLPFQLHKRLGPTLGRRRQIRHRPQPQRNRLQRPQPGQGRKVPLHRLQQHHRRIARRLCRVQRRQRVIARLHQPLPAARIGIQPCPLFIHRHQPHLEVGQRP